MTVQVNDAANFSVTYCSYPEPNWHWEFTSFNSSVGEMDGVDFNPSGNTAAIKIADVQEQHFGNYTITAWNDHGTPTEPAVFMLQARGKNVKIVCHKTPVQEVERPSIVRKEAYAMFMTI